MILPVDPLLPLEQVLEQVARARRSKVGDRAREMSAKHLHLAVFGAEHPEAPWSERLDAWNTTYPDWAYSENRRSNFIRDSVAAKRRLLLQER